MRIAILGQADGWHVRDLLRAASQQNVETECLDFESLAATVTNSARQTASGHSLDQFDAMLVRTMPRGSLEQIIFRMDVLGQVADRGTAVFNPPRALETAIDKYLSLARMQSAGLKVPRTCVTQTANEAIEAFKSLGEDVVVKPLFGGEGRGLMRLTDHELAGRAFRTLEQLQATIYVQEFIDHEGYDIRVLIVGDRVVGMRRRNSADWRTNLRQGAVAEPVTLKPEWIELATKAAAAVGTPIAGVDLLPSKDGRLLALEVNAVPGWRGLQKATGEDIASWIVEHVCSERTALSQ